MRASSTGSLGESCDKSTSPSGDFGSVLRVGFQFVSANSIACEVLSSSVRKTVALLVSPAAIAASREFLYDRRWESRWIIGQRSVERPSSVSTALSGESGMVVSDGEGNWKGVAVGWVLEFGAVPSDSAVITS